MKRMESRLRTFLTGLLIVISFAGCKPLIALYDASAYSQAVSIKVDLLNLLDKAATTEFTAANADISMVTIEIQKAMEYSKGKDLNSLSTSQYEILLSGSHSYKFFLQLWEKEKKLSKGASTEYKETFGMIMDKIIQLENGKNKEKK